MRMDRPAGLTYFALPHIVGTVHAGASLGIGLPRLLQTNAILFCGTIWMRGATVTWNDIVDAPFDRQIVRTRNRAIARGAVSNQAALMFVVCQSLIAATCLVFLPVEAATCTIPAIIGWTIYPLMKRVTYLPQIFLGLPMAWGVLVGEAAMGATSLMQLFKAVCQPDSESARHLSILALFAANAFWTMCYDTIYGFLDVGEDEAAGVKNIALPFHSNDQAKSFLGALAAAVVASLTAAGYLSGYSSVSPYFIGSVMGSATALWVKIWSVDLQNQASCWRWFARGGMMTGSAILGGIIGQYVAEMRDRWL